MEKRKFTRFRAQNDAYAALRADFRKAGKICDISINGLAFRYFADKECNETFNRVDVFLSNSEFHLPEIRCRVVYDVREPGSNSHSLSQFRCGLKFEQMKEENRDKLENFINNHTTGVSKP